MSKLLKSTPKKDGFKMPAEFEKHKGTYLLWPERTDNWRNGAKPAQLVFAKVANLISLYEKVTVGVSKKQYLNALNHLNENVKVVEISNNDSWIRDTGPIFLKDSLNNVRCVSWKFNAWGGLESGLYFPWDQDQLVSHKVIQLEEKDYYNAPLILEGGSVIVDGKGTLFTTEECLLNKNRNPKYSKKEIENILKEYFGVEKVIWIPNGIYNDETSGHVDNILQVCETGKILLAWTDNKNDPQYKISKDAYEILKKQTDLNGKKFDIIKVPIPDPLIIVTEEESLGVDKIFGTLPRKKGDRQAGSYINHYILNGAVLLPIFNIKTDKIAFEIIKKAYPSRKIIPVFAREIILGGGNIHCITQQIY